MCSPDGVASSASISAAVAAPWRAAAHTTTSGIILTGRGRPSRPGAGHPEPRHRSVDAVNYRVFSVRSDGRRKGAPDTTVSSERRHRSVSDDCHGEENDDGVYRSWWAASRPQPEGGLPYRCRSTVTLNLQMETSSPSSSAPQTPLSPSRGVNSTLSSGVEGPTPLHTQKRLQRSSSADTHDTVLSSDGPSSFQPYRVPISPESPPSPSVSPEGSHLGTTVLGTYNFYDRSRTSSLLVRGDPPSILSDSSPEGEEGGPTLLATFNFLGSRHPAPPMASRLTPVDSVPSLTDSIISLEDGKHLLGVFDFTKPGMQRPPPPLALRPSLTPVQRPSPTPVQKPIPTASQKPACVASRKSTPDPPQKPVSGSTQMSAPTPSQKPASDSTQKSPPTPQKPASGSTQKSAPTSSQKPASVLTQKSTPTSSQKPASVSTQKSAPTSSQKPASVSTQKSAPTSSQKPASVSTQKPASVSTQKPASVSTQKSAPTSQKPASDSTQKSAPTSSQKPASGSTQKPAPTPPQKSASAPGEQSAVPFKPSPATKSFLHDRPPPTSTHQSPPSTITEQPAKPSTATRQAPPSASHGASQFSAARTPDVEYSSRIANGALNPRTTPERREQVTRREPPSGGCQSQLEENTNRADDHFHSVEFLCPEEEKQKEKKQEEKEEEDGIVPPAAPLSKQSSLDSISQFVSRQFADWDACSPTLSLIQSGEFWHSDRPISPISALPRKGKMIFPCPLHLPLFVLSFSEDF